MIIIHTSDWHLGHEMYDYGREDEFEDFFRQLESIVADTRPDALLVSGDVYHSTVPTIPTQTMYTEAMLRLHEACPTMHIVVTAGNHDSAYRLEIDRSLWHHFHVHVVGGLVRAEDDSWLDRHIIRIEDKGIVVAVPHVFKQNFPPAVSPNEDRQTSFFKRIMRRALEQNVDGLPIVLMAHLAVQDSSEPHEYSLAGNMEFDDVGTLGGGYDYAALGHLHRPSQVPSASTAVRYCGSPLPISFNEEYEHSVTIAEVVHGQPTRIETRPFKLPREVHTIPIEPVDFDSALEVLKKWPSDDPSYIRLNVMLGGGLPVDASEQALNAVRDKQCRFCTFRTMDKQVESRPIDRIDVSPDEFRELGPLEVAKRYLESEGKSGDELKELIEMMKKTIEQMEMEAAK